jgi:hypothetical protein
MTINTGEKIGELNGTLKTFMDISNKQHAAASASRERIFEKLDEIKDDMADLTSAKDNHHGRLNKIEPDVAEFSKWRERFIGMLMAVTFLSSIVASAVTFMLKKWFLTS